MTNEQLQNKLINILELGNNRVAINSKFVSRYVKYNDEKDKIELSTVNNKPYLAVYITELVLLLNRFPEDSQVICDEEEITDVTSKYFR